MANIRIEMDRGIGWEIRQEGDAAVTAAELVAMLPAYTLSYPHRAFLDGALIANSDRKRNGRVVITRHDA
jgi:hypothetical protein